MRCAMIAAAAALMWTGAVFAQRSSAEQVRQDLAGIALPPGFKIELYALVPGARQLAVAPDASVVFVGTRGSKVYAVPNATQAGAASKADVFAPSVTFKDPNGVCFASDGTLYVAEQNRVLAFPSAAGSIDKPAPALESVVAQGNLVPVAEQSYNHSARVCRVGPDGKLYVALGQPYNVPPKAKLPLYAEWGIGGIVRMDRDGRHREIYASGVRNSVGMDFDSKGELWFTDNQVDGMGDDIPPGEINHVTKSGQNFGFPWYGGGHTRTKEYASETPPAVVFPAVEEVAHAADLGMTFYTGRMFPAKYQGALFSAQHGSWNRSRPVGARVMVTFVKADGTTSPSEAFAEGWRDDQTGGYRGRPVDVAQMADGSLLVSDDQAGAVYRIRYDGPR